MGETDAGGYSYGRNWDPSSPDITVYIRPGLPWIPPLVPPPPNLEVTDTRQTTNLDSYGRVIYDKVDAEIMKAKTEGNLEGKLAQLAKDCAYWDADPDRRGPAAKVIAEGIYRACKDAAFAYGLENVFSEKLKYWSDRYRQTKPR